MSVRRRLRGGGRDLADQVDFVVDVGPAVRPENIVKPRFRLALARLLPRVPREVRLRAAAMQAPAHGADVLAREQRQDRLEGAAQRTRHVFGADQRTVEAAQLGDARRHRRSPVVTVEGDDIGDHQLQPPQRRQRGILPVSDPNTAGERLARRLQTRPCERPGKQRENDIALGRSEILGCVGGGIGIVRLVPEIPHQDARVVAEAADEPAHVAFQLGETLPRCAAWRCQDFAPSRRCARLAEARAGGLRRARGSTRCRR